MTTTNGRTWARKSSEPITTQRQVVVVDADGNEGWANVSWVAGAAVVRGPVKHLERVFDGSGAEVEEPRVTILDRDPKFA